MSVMQEQMHTWLDDQTDMTAAYNVPPKSQEK